MIGRLQWPGLENSIKIECQEIDQSKIPKHKECQFLRLPWLLLSHWPLNLNLIHIIFITERKPHVRWRNESRTWVPAQLKTPRWKKVWPLVDHYIGEYSIYAESSYTEIEVLQNFITLESGTGPKRNWSFVKQEKINCSQEDFSTLSFVVFLDLNGLGEVLESFTQIQIRWKKINSDEDITKIHRVVCSNTASS